MRESLRPSTWWEPLDVVACPLELQRVPFRGRVTPWRLRVRRRLPDPLQQSRVLDKLEFNNRVQIALLAHDADEA
jgi:hypothetical protein